MAITRDHDSHRFDKHTRKAEMARHIGHDHFSLLRGIPTTAYSIVYLREQHNAEHNHADADAQIDKTPRKRTSVYDGGGITCPECGNDTFIEHPRSLDFYDYECARCFKHIAPYTETGASR